jgi:putative transposase
MSHAHAANFVHCVFSTKERRNRIPVELQEKLYAYLIGIADNLELKIVAAGGTANHVHLLIGLPPSLTLAEVVQKLKANSSRWLGRGLNGRGGMARSVLVHRCCRRCRRTFAIRRNIIKRSFEEEFVSLLRKSGVAYDAKLLFAA